MILSVTSEICISIFAESRWPRFALNVHEVRTRHSETEKPSVEVALVHGTIGVAD